MADEENIQDPPSEVVENEEAKEEPTENDAAETPAESGNAEDKANDEAANTAESSEIPPPEEADKEDVAADGEEKGEQDETDNEIAVDSTEEEKANEQEVVETTDGAGDAETAEKAEDVQDKGTDGEAAETAEATSEEKLGSPSETPMMTDEIENQNEAPTEDVAKDASETGEDKDGAPTGEQPQEGQAEVAETTDAEADAADNEKPAEAEDDRDEKPASPIPQSDTFQDGERPETPTVQVPEPISREASPKEEPQHLDAGTPEMEESPRHEDIIEEEEEEEEPFYSREELLEAFQAALAEREQLQNHNTQLQHKLAEYFRKKKSDDQRQEMDKNVTDQEQRYLKYMSNLEELRNQEEEERENFQVHLEELKEKKQEKLELVEKEDKTFTELKRTVALEAISSRTGKPLMPREVEMYISNEQRKEEEVKSVRLDNIKLKNRLKKREQQLKAKEELAEGLHLIDFEQLKIENQTYNEKIEERNEELLKLRKKITSTVQVLTHVKEKLQFVQGENHVQKSTLREVEAHVAQKRDLLSRTKKARDSLRIDNQKLRQKSGLLGNKALLRDFEERKDEGEELRNRLDRLKRQHAELILKSAGVKKKIDETRA